MDLDTITKYESGFLVLDQSPFDMLALVNEVVESLELQAKEKKIGLQVFAPAGIIRWLAIAVGFRRCSPIWAIIPFAMAMKMAIPVSG